MGRLKKCPMCGVMNDDNWSLYIKGRWRDGGCQNCWESVSAAAWWELLEEIGEVLEGEGKKPCPMCGNIMDARLTVCAACKADPRN